LHAEHCKTHLTFTSVAMHSPARPAMILVAHLIRVSVMHARAHGLGAWIYRDCEPRRSRSRSADAGSSSSPTDSTATRPSSDTPPACSDAERLRPRRRSRQIQTASVGESRPQTRSRTSAPRCSRRGRPGHALVSTRTACRRTATSRRARPRWRRFAKGSRRG
jgi:hypothetical protein